MEDIEEKYEALSYKKGKRKASSSEYQGVGRDKSKNSIRGERRSRIDGKRKEASAIMRQKRAARRTMLKEHDFDEN